MQKAEQRAIYQQRLSILMLNQNHNPVSTNMWPFLLHSASKMLQKARQGLSKLQALFFDTQKESYFTLRSPSNEMRYSV